MNKLKRWIISPRISKKILIYYMAVFIISVSFITLFYEQINK